MPFSRHVTLGFYYGGGLPDPANMLGEGSRQVSGKLSMRSLKIGELTDIERPQVCALVEAAVSHLRATSLTRK
jgi:hypothetical protein